MYEGYVAALDTGVYVSSGSDDLLMRIIVALAFLIVLFVVGIISGME